MKKTLFLILAVFCILQTRAGALHKWTDGSGNHMYSTSANWDVGSVPTFLDDIQITGFDSVSQDIPVNFAPGLSYCRDMLFTDNFSAQPAAVNYQIRMEPKFAGALPILWMEGALINAIRGVDVGFGIDLQLNKDTLIRLGATLPDRPKTYFNFYGSIRGNGNLNYITDLSDGTYMVISGNQNNSFDGAIGVTDGWLILEKDPNIIAVPGDLVLGHLANVRTDQPFQFGPSNTVFLLDATANLDLSGNSQTISSLSYSTGNLTNGANFMDLNLTQLGRSFALWMGSTTIPAQINLHFTSTIPNQNDIYISGPVSPNIDSQNLDLGMVQRDITVDDVSGQLTINSTISGSGGIRKLGPGTLVIAGTGVNSFTGESQINEGILHLDKTSALTGDLWINGGTVRALDNDVFHPLNTRIRMSDGTLNFNITISNTAQMIHSLEYIGGTLAAPSALTNLTFSDDSNFALKTNANLTIPNNLYLTCGGTIPRTGNISVASTGKTLSIPTSLELGSVERIFDVAMNSTLDISGTIINSSGGIIKEGPGMLILSGNNTYSGGTVVNKGILRITMGDANLGAGNLTLSGAELNVTNTVTLSKLIELNNTNEISVDTLGTLLGLNGDLSGPGGFVKTGAGTLQLGGLNTYSGGTRILEGILSGTATSLQGNIVNDNQVVFNQLVNGTYPGAMSGSGAVVKDGAGNLTFTGLNTYSGGTDIVLGTLTGNTNSLQGYFHNLGTIVFDQAFGGTFGGFIVGSGTVEKKNVGNLTLMGANSYSGGTTILDGTLTVSTSSLPGDVVNNSSLVFDQNFDGTFSGRISGTGSLKKKNSGDVTLAGANSYTGDTVVSSGRLIINGSLGDTEVKVSPGAVLKGIGQIGTTSASVTNNGQVAPGNSPGTLTIMGDYYQNNSGDLFLEIQNLSSYSKLVVSERALLNGELSLSFLSGYSVSTSDVFTLIDTGNGVLGNFDDVNYFGYKEIPFYEPLISYTDKQVLLSWKIIPITPTNPPVNYSIGSVMSIGQQNQIVKRRMDPLNCCQCRATSEPKKAKTKKFPWWKTQKTEEEKTCMKVNPWTLYAGPLGNITKIKQGLSVSGSRNHGVGAFLGGDYRFSEGMLGLMTSYEYRDSKITNDFGHSHMNNGRLFLYGSYTPSQVKNLCLNGIFGGGLEWLDIYRNIDIGSTHLTAFGKPKGSEVDGYLELEYGYCFKHFQIIPEIALQYIRTKIDGYEETGSGLFGGQWGHHASDSFRSILGLKMKYCLERKNLLIVPELDISYEGELMNPKSKVMFFDAANHPTKLTVGGMGRNFGKAGAAISLYRDIYIVEARYDFELSKYSRTHYFSVELGCNF